MSKKIVALSVVVFFLQLQSSHPFFSANVYERHAFPFQRLSVEERDLLQNCPCGWDRSLCLPVTLGSHQRKRNNTIEVFAFSVATDDRWKQYDWEQLTTVAWNMDKDLLCHAHSKGVKVVVKHNFDDVDTLCDPRARREWVQTTYNLIINNYADGVNIDTEKAMHGANAKCLTSLVLELRQELQRHALTKQAQITFDVSWSPRGVDGRYYQWKELAAAVDFLFVMSYDMRSQIYYQCIAGANSPLDLVKQGLQEFILGYEIDPQKLVLGVPWYGYKYGCQNFSGVDSICAIKQIPFFDAPCSDAAGEQVNYGDIRRMLREHPNLIERWDNVTQSPYIDIPKKFENSGDDPIQFWYDNPRSLRLKYDLVKELSLYGVGMWNADTLDYTGDERGMDDTKEMWASLREAIDTNQEIKTSRRA